uniref:Uncharacterized protein n=1 Tax=Sphaerodactylus townsendi TaxID=933632 RepID=A0ACB8FH94_9SAUR
MTAVLITAMEGYGKNANPLKFRIPKKKANMQSDEIRIQSPLSRLTDAHHWDYPLKEWKLETRNNLYHTNCNRKRRCEKYHINDDATTLGQPKVMLTNVLKTEVGRKYIKTHPITDANLSHVVKLQSTQQTSSSADSIEIWQILSSPHQSLFISKRQPKVTLTNVLRTRTGRKYVQTHLLADANLSDASNLQSDEEPSSSVASLESCQKISSQQSCILSKRSHRYGRFHRRSNDHLWKPCKDIESSSAVPTLRRCDVVLEDCSIQNKERECQDRRTKDSKNASPGLRETCFQNNECRKRRGEDFSSQRSVFSRRKSSLPSKEQSTEPVEPPGQERNPQQENILQSLELDCYETFTTANQDTAVTCPGESCSKISPKRKQHSVVSKDVQISPPVSSPKKQEGNTAVPSEEPGTILKKNKQMTESAEPIVVSSDEEESAEAKYTKLCLQTTKGHLPESKETEQGYVLPLSEELSQGLIENKTEQASTESPTLKATSNCMTSEQADFALDVKSAVVFIGKYKGTATGCIRFSTSYIKIPFEALNKNVDLLIDTRHFKKIGLWTDHKDSSTSRSDTVIFLWLSSNYVEQIENQIGTSVLNKNAVKSTEFLFLKLSQSLTEGEQVILNKIILEISKKNSTPDLIDFFPWKQAVLLLQDISAEECSFFDDCNMLLQELKKSTTVLEELQPQESKLSPTKPSYCLLQKQSGGKYSFSISSAKEDEWKEFQDTRPVQCLMVYPPPPAKGGLGVTREDLECLDYGEFLNDVIIDFYLKSHWYIAIICFPWLEEVVYEDCLDPCSLQSPTPQFPVHLETKTETVRTETVLVFSDNRNDEEMDMNSHLQLNDNGQPERLSPASGSISSKAMYPHFGFPEGKFHTEYSSSLERSPIVNFEVPLHLDRWFPRQAVRNKREEIRDLILQLHLQQQRGSKS